MANGFRNILGEERIETWLFQIGNTILDAILNDWFFGVASGVTYFGVLKRWTGVAWVKEPLKTYLAGSFQSKPLKRWNGSEWKLIDTAGI